MAEEITDNTNQDDTEAQRNAQVDEDVQTEDASSEIYDERDVDDDALEDESATLSEEEKQRRLHQLKPIIEGALLAANETLKLGRLQDLFDEREKPSKGLLLEVLCLIQDDCEGRGFELAEVATGWRFQVPATYAPWVNRLWDEKPQKYSRAMLETLALIAYRQPLTRSDIEEVRGVAVSSHIIKTLSERDWVKVVGHRDVPGRPALYATTRQFLDYFNLKSLEELPSLGELKDIDSLNQSLALTEPTAVMEAQKPGDDDAAPQATSETEQVEIPGPPAVSDENLDPDLDDGAAEPEVAQSEGTETLIDDAEMETTADDLDVVGDESVHSEVHDFDDTDADNELQDNH